jgi:hypothetical protein
MYFPEPSGTFVTAMLDIQAMEHGAFEYGRLADQPNAADYMPPSLRRKRREKRYFIPMPAQLTEEQVKRFWATMSPHGDCLIWKGHCRASGKATVTFNRQPFAVQRVAYWLQTGVDPEHKFTVSTCITPGCCSAGHIQLTSRANVTSDGEANFQSKLTNADVLEIFRLREEGKVPRQIGELLGVHRTTVGTVLRGKYWKHVPRPTSQGRYLANGELTK